MVNDHVVDCFRYKEIRSGKCGEKVRSSYRSRSMITQ
jgi:hypothetical protein